VNCAPIPLANQNEAMMAALTIKRAVQHSSLPPSTLLCSDRLHPLCLCSLLANLPHMPSVQMAYSFISTATLSTLKAYSPPAQNQEDLLMAALQKARKNEQSSLSATSLSEPGHHPFLATAFDATTHRIVGFVLGNLVLGDDTDDFDRPIAPQVHASRERIYVFQEYGRRGYGTQIIGEVLRAEKAAGARWTTVAIQMSAFRPFRQRAC
jgi:GNAT superfamily N-acetyltransferase